MVISSAKLLLLLLSFSSTIRIIPPSQIRSTLVSKVAGCEGRVSSSSKVTGAENRTKIAGNLPQRVQYFQQHCLGYKRSLGSPKIDLKFSTFNRLGEETGAITGLIDVVTWIGFILDRVMWVARVFIAFSPFPFPPMISNHQIHRVSTWLKQQ
nr:hypothetical protein Iba_chr08eCG5060 [Ipomoea batatas]